MSYRKELSSSPINTSITLRKTVSIYFCKTSYLGNKRKISLVGLLGVTKSISESSGEFVVHIKGEYDYRMKAEVRD